MSSSEFVWDTVEPPESHAYLFPAVLRLLRSGGAKRVLDLGCGNGALSAALAAEGLDVVGVDSSESGIARARVTHPGLRFDVYAVGAELPAEHRSAFDAVVSTEVIEHLLLPRQLFTCARSAAKPGGLLVVSTPYHGYVKNLCLALANHFDAHWHPLRDYGHVKFFSKKTLRSLFVESGLSEIQFQAVGRIPILAKSMIMCGRFGAPS